MITPRPYQVEATDAAFREWAQGRKSTLISLPTGCGKTVVFSLVIKKFLEENPNARALVLAHREELIFQARDEIAPIVGITPDLEMGEFWAVCSQKAGSWIDPSRVVVGSVQSLFKESRLKRFASDHFDLVIVDEAHHMAKKTKTYWNIREHLHAAKWLGVTATPRRGDNIALGESFDSVAYEMPIQTAVGDGWLVPVKQQFITVQDVDLAPLTTQAGDFNQKALAAVMNAPHVVKAVAVATIQECGDEPTLIFTVDVQQAVDIADLINALRPGSAVALSGKTNADDRRRHLQRFEAGEFQFLLGCALFTEGFNSPRISRVVMARPTKSVVYYCLDEQTEILTDRGWVGYAEWDTIDQSRAAGYDLDTGELVWTDIQAKFRRPISEGEKMYELKTEQIDIRVSEAHRLLYRSATERRASDLFQLIPAQELASRKSEYEIPVSGVQKSAGLPLTDDEIRFIGWYMTDGTISKHTGQFLLRQALHQPWLGKIHECLQGCGFKYGYREYVRSTKFKAEAHTAEFYVSKGKPRGTDKDKRGWGALSSYMCKDFSPELEDASPEQLAVLLEAMHLGDGAKQMNQTWKRRSYHIYTSNKVMADRLQSLCVRRGFKCNVADHSRGRKSAFYCLHIKREVSKHIGGSGYTDRPTLRESQTTPGEILWCITTGTSTIVTRRNGKVAIMGQTQAIGRGTRPLRGVLTPDLVTPEQRIAAIANSKKPDMVVLDFVGNSGRHKLVSTVDSFAGESAKTAVEKAKAKALKTGKPMEIKAEIDKEEREEKQREQAKRDRLQRAIEAQIRGNAKVHKQDVNPYEIGDTMSVGNQAKAKPADGSPVSKHIRHQIDKMGGVVPEQCTHKQAGQIYAECIARRRKGLCSHKQENILKRHRLAKGPIQREHASALISLLKAREWQTPDYDLTRDMLSIKEQDGGYQLVIRDPDYGTIPVGGVYTSTTAVREVYGGLAMEPATLV